MSVQKFHERRLVLLKQAIPIHVQLQGPFLGVCLAHSFASFEVLGQELLNFLVMCKI